MAKLKQCMLTCLTKRSLGNNNYDYILKDSSPPSLDQWTDGSMGGILNTDDTSKAYSLQIYGKPGTQFYLNDGLVPIEIGPSGYYGLELNDYAIINKLSFDEETLQILYDETANPQFIPLVVDIKLK